MTTHDATPGNPGVQQFIVAAQQPDVLNRVIEELRSAPDTTLLRVTGDPAAPERAVVEMSQERADLLQQTFAGQLIIEPDRPLNLGG